MVCIFPFSSQVPSMFLKLRQGLMRRIRKRQTSWSYFWNHLSAGAVPDHEFTSLFGPSQPWYLKLRRKFQLKSPASVTVKNAWNVFFKPEKKYSEQIKEKQKKTADKHNIKSIHKKGSTTTASINKKIRRKNHPFTAHDVAEEIEEKKLEISSLHFSSTSQMIFFFRLSSLSSVFVWYDSFFFLLADRITYNISQYIHVSE